MKKMTLQLGLIAIVIAIVIALLSRLARREPSAAGTPPQPATIADARPQNAQLPSGAVPTPPPATPSVAPQQKLDKKVETNNDGLMENAPQIVRDQVARDGIPPLPLGTNDPYREVTFVNPNGGLPITRKAHSVEPIVGPDGATNAFAISYMKGQRPFTNANDGTIIVGPVIIPGGDK